MSFTAIAIISAAVIGLIVVLLVVSETFRSVFGDIIMAIIDAL